VLWATVLAWVGLLFWILVGRNGTLFPLDPELLYVSAAAIMIIIIFSALISIRKVMRLEPAIVFKA